MDLQILQEKKKQVINDKSQSEHILKKAELSMQKVRLNIVRLDAQLALLDDMIQTEEAKSATEAEEAVAAKEPISELDEH